MNFRILLSGLGRASRASFQPVKISEKIPGVARVLVTGGLISTSIFAIAASVPASPGTQRKNRRMLWDDAETSYLEKAKREWQNLGDSRQTMLALVGINVAVFALGRLPVFQRAFQRHFIHRHDQARGVTMVTSSYAHAGALHLLMNMVGLYSFGVPVHQILGREQFLAFYTAGSVLSVTFSQVYRIAASRFLPGPSLVRAASLGASGGVLAVFALYAYHFPQSEIALVFLPMMPIPVSYALPAMVGFDTLGLLLRWRTIDHAAHLGGVFFGWLYALYGRSAWLENVNQRKW